MQQRQVSNGALAGLRLVPCVSLAGHHSKFRYSFPHGYYGVAVKCEPVQIPTVMRLREWTETPENRPLALGSGLESSHWLLGSQSLALIVPRYSLLPAVIPALAMPRRSLKRFTARNPPRLSAYQHTHQESRTSAEIRRAWPRATYLLGLSAVIRTGQCLLDQD